MMKTGLRVVMELLAMTLLVPQVFVLCYYFTYFFEGGNQLGLGRTLAVYALTISWVSAPFLALLYVLVKALIGSRVSGYVTLLLCVGAGYLWLAAWNVLVYNIFSYWRAAFPILLCSLGTAGYALARKLFLESLPPPEKKKSVEAGLQE